MPVIETIPIDDFNQRLKSKASELKIPFEVTLELTYACNLRCVHCYNPVHHATPQELSGHAFRSVIDQLVEADCMLVLFSGGEPFVRPDAFELFEYAKNAGLQIAVNTNATLLTPEKVERLADLAPTLLSVSVYGVTEETYESVTGVQGSFHKFMHGLSLLENYPHPLHFKMPVMTKNVHELESARAWFARKNWKLVHSVEIHPRTDGNLDPLAVRLSPEQTAKLRLKYDETTRCGGYGRAQGESGQAPNQLFDCQCGKNSFAVSPYGEMNLCVTTPYPQYSLKTGSVKEGWNLLINFVEGFTPSAKHECPACHLAPYCSQGSMDAFLNTGDFNPCLPYFKETAGKIKHLLEIKNEI